MEKITENIREKVKEKNKERWEKVRTNQRVKFKTEATSVFSILPPQSRVLSDMSELNFSAQGFGEKKAPSIMH